MIKLGIIKYKLMMSKIKLKIHIENYYMMILNRNIYFLKNHHQLLI